MFGSLSLASFESADNRGRRITGRPESNDLPKTSWTVVKKKLRDNNEKRRRVEECQKVVLPTSMKVH